MVRPHKSVTSKTLSRWVREVLGAAGIDTSQWDPHSTRAASAAHHLSNNSILAYAGGPIGRKLVGHTKSFIKDLFKTVYVFVLPSRNIENIILI